MNLNRVTGIIDETELLPHPAYGYMVSFYWQSNGFRCPDYFPDPLHGERLFDTESMAWKWAREFASKTKGVCVNITVVTRDFTPAGNPDNVIENW